MTDADREHSTLTVTRVFTIAIRKASRLPSALILRRYAPNLPYWGGFSSLLIHRKALASIGHKWTRERGDMPPATKARNQDTSQRAGSVADRICRLFLASWRSPDRVLAVVLVSPQRMRVRAAMRAPAHGGRAAARAVEIMLFLLGGREVRLPCRDLTVRRRGDHLGLLLLWLLGFAIASLLAFGHLSLPWFAFRANPVHQTAEPAVRRAYPHVHVAPLQEPPARFSARRLSWRPTSK
jgi:hypothetical protein